MTKGRKPTPTVLKLLRGNPGKRPINGNEPKPSPRAPGMPTWLANEARAEWRRVVPELDRLGLLARVDRGTLAAYCETWATFVAAQREVHEHGLVILKKVMEAETDDGMLIIYQQPAKNPAVLIARDAAAQIRAFCSEFGLSPSARTRLETPEPDAGADDVESLLS